LTGETYDGIEQDCKAAGMDAVMNKPVDLAQLRRLLRRHAPRGVPASGFSPENPRR
jgi:CheY-like chemotaxis protein